MARFLWRLDLPDALGEANGQLPVRQLRHLQRRGGDDLAQRQRGGALLRQVTDVGPEELLGGPGPVLDMAGWWLRKNPSEKYGSHLG